MRPLELELEGFGPYKDKQLVPFSALDPIFLIGGDTGAGKTTLFDAISYALYGAPLGTREVGHLRSHLADERTPTYVRLTFACGGKTWEVRRSPYWPRESKRGSGVVVETLLEVREGERLLPGKPSDLNAYLAREVVRLSHEEFSKILVLPQGEFQRFLEMASPERAKILEKLFPTDEHRRLTQLAREQAKEATRALDELLIRQKAALEGFDPAGYDARVAAWTDEIAACVAAEAVAAEQRARAARTLEAGRTLAGQLAALAEAREAAGRREASQGEADARRAELDASRRATRVAPASQAEEQALQRLEQLKREREKLASERATLTPRRDAVAPEIAALAQREERLRARDVELERARQRVDDLHKLHQANEAVDAAREALVTAEAARPDPAVRVAAEAHVAALAEVEARREACVEAQAARAADLARLDLLQNDARRVELWDGTQRAERDAARATGAATMARLEAAERDAQEVLASARARREAQAAAILAATLQPGEPCPVCGSAEHPAPNPGADGGEDARAAVLAAEAAVRSAGDARVAHRDALQEMEGKYKGYEDAKREADDRLVAAGLGRDDGAGGDAARWRAARADAEAAARAAAEALQAAQRELQTRAAREKAVADARGREEEAERKVVEARLALDKAAGARDELAGRVGEVADVVAEGRALEARRVEEERALEAERAAIGALRQAWTDLNATLTSVVDRWTALGLDLDAQGATLERARADLAAALAEHGFLTAADALAARRPAADEARLARQVATWDEEGVALAERTRQLVEAVGEQAAPDLAALASAEADAVAAARAATEARAGKEAALSDLHRRHASYALLVEEKAKLERGSAGLVQLAKDLQGDNGARIDFPTFILTWWLERVLVRATARLRVLSEGRYAFALRAEGEDKRKSAGLDLDVYDAHTSERRDVRSLSGGEKFLASMSLALGLADVIQERAGGVELDTLFIDEGFGSLDPSALDRALQVIDEIGAHRRVGLISHVEAMKKAIPCHVRVEKSVGGSRVRLGG